MLLSGKSVPSHVLNDSEEFRGSFAIPPLSTTAPDDNLKFELQITIYRRGIFTRKLKFVLSTHLSVLSPLRTDDFDLRMRQRIRYSAWPLARPIPSTLSPLAQNPAKNPRNPPSSWKANDYPGVIVKGVIFQQHLVEVECKASKKILSINHLPDSWPCIFHSSSYQYVTPFCLPSSSVALVYLPSTLLDFIPSGR